MKRRAFLTALFCAPALPLEARGPDLNELRRIVKTESFVPSKLAAIYGGENVTMAMWGTL
jgi:hypothetical protein